MYLSQFHKNRNVLTYSKQKGLGLPVAIFIITIMSLIAVAVNRLNVSSSQSYSQNVLSTRAFYAAESGAQLRSRTVLTTPSCTCGSDVDFEFDVAGLSQCRAATTCTSFIANGETYCTIQSIGRCDGSNAKRGVEVRLR